MPGEKHVISLSTHPHTLALTHGGWTGGDEGEGGEAFFFRWMFQLLDLVLVLNCSGM